QPAERQIVGSHHGGVRDGALAEVDPAVARDGGPVRVVIAPARQAVHQRLGFPVDVDPQNPTALALAAFGHVERAVVVRDAVPWTVVAAARDLCESAVAVLTHEARSLTSLAIGIAGFHDD